jgi:DNA ligase-associated metallophosphoesterase
MHRLPRRSTLWGGGAAKVPSPLRGGTGWGFNADKAAILRSVPRQTEGPDHTVLTALHTEEATPLVLFAGEIFEPMLSGALFWRAQRTLLVADLHLEKFSSYASSGQLLPPYDTALTLKRLAHDLKTTGAERVIALGDSFHRDAGTRSLMSADRDGLTMLVESVDWLWLAGNHDPAPHALGGTCASFVALGEVLLVHEPRRAEVGVIAGHLHPAAHIAINGRSVKRPCFAHDTGLLILPAYGSTTGSINVLGPAFSGLFARSQLQVTMLGRDRLYPVSPRRLVA